MAPTNPYHADHECDDGLVHSHGWSSSDPIGSAPPRTRHPLVRGHDHDDGLVHDHGWARN